VLFFSARWFRAPRGLSFAIEDSTLLSSSRLWGYCSLIIGFGFLALLQSLPLPAASAVDPESTANQRDTRSSLPLKLLGLVAIALGIGMLLGVLDGFHRIDDAGNGRWSLAHAARGTLVTFSRADLVSIDATETNAKRGPNSRHIVVTLTGGRSYSESTRSMNAFQELRDFATTADLTPGTVHIRPYRGKAWTNGACGYALKDFVGRFEHASAAEGERSTLEFLAQNNRLEGKETSYLGAKAIERSMRNLKLSDTGKAEFELGNMVKVGAASNEAWSLSLRWSTSRQSVQLTNAGLEMGTTTYARR
jgi:hypothetical protein